jgi:DNA-binding NtrC family response regulator
MSRILIVDDEAPIREVLSTFLEEIGYEAHALADGESAINWLREEKPDLILLDVRMPGMSGLDVLKNARQLYPEMPVIMISGYADEDLAREALQEGAYDFFLKPFELSVIEARLFAKLGFDSDVAQG